MGTTCCASSIPKCAPPRAGGAGAPPTRTPPSPGAQLARLRSLKRISLEDNELEVFPEVGEHLFPRPIPRCRPATGPRVATPAQVLLELRELEALRLSGNGLTQLPESLSRLEALRELVRLRGVSPPSPTLFTHAHTARAGGGAEPHLPPS